MPQLPIIVLVVFIFGLVALQLLGVLYGADPVEPPQASSLTYHQKEFHAIIVTEGIEHEDRRILFKREQPNGVPVD